MRINHYQKNDGLLNLAYPIHFDLVLLELQHCGMDGIALFSVKIPCEGITVTVETHGCTMVLVTVFLIRKAWKKKSYIFVTVTENGEHSGRHKVKKLSYFTLMCAPLRMSMIPVITWSTKNFIIAQPTTYSSIRWSAQFTFNRWSRWRFLNANQFKKKWR